MAYELIERQVIFEGRKCRVEVHQLRDPSTGQRIAREVVAHPGAVVVLPILPDGRIILISNQRYAVGQNLIELPAGTLDPNEDPMNCAGRELLEETGYLAGRLGLFASFFTSPGILTEKMYAFAAYDLELREPQREEGEDIELVPSTLNDAIAMIGHGSIVDAKTIATLMMYDRFRRDR